MKGLTCIVVFCMAVVVSETNIVERPCPTEITSVPDFKLKKYEGTWYTQYRTPFDDNKHDCTSTTVIFNRENGYFLKLSSTRKNHSPDHKRFVLYDDVALGTFRISPLGENIRIPAISWVLDTDYKTYSVRFTCYNKGNKSHQVLSLQTRQRLPGPSLLNIIRIKASTLGFSLKTVEQVNQEDCPALLSLSDESNESDSDEDYDQ